MDLILQMAPFVLVPMVLLLLVRPTGRLVFGILGLLFGLGTEFLMDLGGPHSPGNIIPELGVALAVAALMAQVVAGFSGLLKQRSAAHG